MNHRILFEKQTAVFDLYTPERAQNPRFEEYAVADNHITYFPLPYRAGESRLVYAYPRKEVERT